MPTQATHFYPRPSPFKSNQIKAAPLLSNYESRGPTYIHGRNSKVYILFYSTSLHVHPADFHFFHTQKHTQKHNHSRNASLKWPKNCGGTHTKGEKRCKDTYRVECCVAAHPCSRRMRGKDIVSLSNCLLVVVVQNRKQKNSSQDSLACNFIFFLLLPTCL